MPLKLKGCGGRGCGAEHAAHTAVGAVPIAIARKREPWQPVAAATAAGPRLAQLAQGAARPPCADGAGARPGQQPEGRVLYAAQGNIYSWYQTRVFSSVVKMAHFAGEHNAEYNTEYNNFSSYRV